MDWMESLVGYCPHSGVVVISAPLGGGGDWFFSITKTSTMGELGLRLRRSVLVAGVTGQSLRRVSLAVLPSYLFGLASDPPGWAVLVLDVGGLDLLRLVLLRLDLPR